MSPSQLEELFEKRLSWLVKDYGLTRAEVPVSQYTAGRIMVLKSETCTITIVHELFEIATELDTPEGTQHGYSLGCIASYILRKYKIGIYSGPFDEQTERISKLLKLIADTLFKTNFMSENKAALDEFKERWRQRAMQGPDYKLF